MEQDLVFQLAGQVHGHLIGVDDGDDGLTADVEILTVQYGATRYDHFYFQIVTESNC